MRLSPLGWLRPRARVRGVDEKGVFCWREACSDERVGGMWLGDGLRVFEARRGICNAAARDCRTGLSFILILARFAVDGVEVGLPERLESSWLVNMHKY